MDSVKSHPTTQHPAGCSRQLILTRRQGLAEVGLDNLLQEQLALSLSIAGGRGWIWPQEEPTSILTDTGLSSQPFSGVDPQPCLPQ